MGKMQVNCPYCNAALAAEYEWVGHMLECPDCHQRFTCPAGGEYADSYKNTGFTPPPPPGMGGFAPPPPQNPYGNARNPYGNPYQNPYQNPYGNPYQNPYGNFNAPQQPRATMFTALQKYADFSGRASRREFWLFVIFTQLVQFGIGFVCGLFLGYSDETLIIIGGLVMLFGLFTLIPNLAVGVRRCHDIGRSGWWLLIALVPCIGPIWLLILLALPSDVYNNQYGPNPNGAYPDEAWPAVVGILLLFISVLLNYAV